MIIRKMKENDVPRVAELEAVSFSVSWTEEMLRDSLNNEASTCFLAEEDGKLLGYCAFMMVLDEGELCRLCVFPEYKRKGIGSTLLDHMIEYMKSFGVIVISLEVREGNAPAIELYEKKGFCRIGLRKDYYRNPKENGLTMQMELNNA